MTINLGMIAEDQSDIDTIKVFLDRFSKRQFRIQKFTGDGCGKIKSKCLAWSNNLYDRGCRLLIVVHDLDDKVLKNLRKDLEDSLKDSSIRNRVVVIPIREIEAWLLSDTTAIVAALKIKQNIGVIGGVENIRDPKSKLRNLIFNRSNHKISYLPRQHNPKIALRCSLARLKSCSSFVSFYSFVEQNMM